MTDADNREVLEYDGTSGALERWYAFGRDPDAVLGQMNIAAGTRQTMIPDIQGSIIGTLDSGTGALAKSGYQAFGENPSVTTGTYRYTARRFDPETAGSTAQPSGLYYYRARMYSPTWGRFLQPDPIGYAAGPNLYAYVNNDPLDATDPTGTCYPACTIIVGASIGAVIGGTHAYLEGGDISAILAGAGTGAAFGAVIGSGIPLALGTAIAGAGASTTAVAAATYGATVAISTGAGFATDVAAQLTNITTGNQAQLSWSQAGISTAEGFATGALGSGFIKAGEAIAEIGGLELGTASGIAGEVAAGQIEAAGTGIGTIVNHALK